MKFLHTADLHIGKRMNDINLLEDQKIVLTEIAEIAAEEKAEAVVIAGDIYQKSTPPAEAAALFDAFVTALAEQGIKVLMISGNHDSDKRISYFSSLIRGSGVYASEAFDGRLQQVTLADAYGPVVFHLLPFVKPAVVKKALPQEEITTYQDGVEAVLAHSAVDKSLRNVLVCHQFITGAETSDSEEPAVGGLDNIDAGIFEDFDYVALGHIHKPQRAGRETMRYAGSPLKYSLSEAAHRKSVTLVELGEKGDIVISSRPLTQPHDVREVRGTLTEVMEMDYSEDYVRVTLTDELPPPDARVTVTTVFPNMMKFAIENSKTKVDTDVTAKETVEAKSPTALFCDFYRLQNNDVLPTQDHLDILQEVLLKLENKTHETD